MRLLWVVDSVAREGDGEKTEFARFFFLQQWDFEHRFELFSIYNARRLSALANSFRNPIIKSLCKFYSGQWLCNRANYTQGMELILEALSECKTIGYEKVPRIYVLFYVVSTHYYNFNNYRKCIEYAELATRYGNREQTIGLYNTYGLAYQKLAVYESAAVKFKQTVVQARMHKVFVWEYIASGNLGRTYCLQERFAEGLPLLYLDVTKGADKEPANAAVSALYMAEAYCKLRRPDSARHFIALSKEPYTRRFLWMSDQFFGSKICWYYYQVTADWLKLQQRYAEALRYTDTAVRHEKKSMKSSTGNCSRQPKNALKASNTRKTSPFWMRKKNTSGCKKFCSSLYWPRCSSLRRCCLSGKG